MWIYYIPTAAYWPSEDACWPLCGVAMARWFLRCNQQVSYEPGGNRWEWGMSRCGANAGSPVGMTPLLATCQQVSATGPRHFYKEPDCWVKVFVQRYSWQDLISCIWIFVLLGFHFEAKSLSALVWTINHLNTLTQISWSISAITQVPFRILCSFLDSPKCYGGFPVTSERSGFFPIFPRKASCYSFSKVVGKQDFRFCNSQRQQGTHDINTHARLYNTT